MIGKTILRNDEINNCISIVEYGENEQIISKKYLNGNNQIIFTPSYPHIIKTPDKYNKQKQKEGLWTVFLNKSFQPHSDIETASYYRIATYGNGIPIEIVRDYFMDGSIQFEGRMISEFPSVYQDTIRIYNNKGFLLAERCYKDGKKNGVYRTFDNNGKLILDVSYKNNMYDGYYTSYNIITGKLIENLFYKNGKQDSLNYFYDGYSGILYDECNYKSGRRHGMQNLYDKNGKLKTKGKWNKNSRIGFCEFYNNDELDKIEYYQNGKKIEPIILSESNIFDFILAIFINQNPNIVYPIENTEWDIELMLPELMKYLDSDIEVYKVIPIDGTQQPENFKSTLGQEIMYLIEGYRQGIYPPPNCSRNDFIPIPDEYRAWWMAKKDFLIDKE